MATRKEQIERFRENHRETRSDGSSFLKADREEFLAYAFVRGRHYKQCERTLRPNSEKLGPDFFQTLAMIQAHFPVPDRVPVPVGPDGSEEPPPTPRKYPWPELDYDNLADQVRDWFLQELPADEQQVWEQRQALMAHSKQVRKGLNVWTPERVALGKADWHTSIEVRVGEGHIFRARKGDREEYVIGETPEICWKALAVKLGV